MKIVKVLVKLEFPDNYTDEQIKSIMENCDYTFNYPVEDNDDDDDNDNEVRAIDSEITDYEIK